jgi:transposase InsO family protein
MRRLGSKRWSRIFVRRAQQSRPAERKAVIDRGNVLLRHVPPARLAIMHRIDALHGEYPFAGSRMMRDLLRAEGITIGRLAVATLMRRMCIEALYQRPNQVWAMDITYIPMARGFVCLRAYDGVSDARASLGRYLDCYNTRRPHSSLGTPTPERAYPDHLPQVLAA